MGRIYLVYPVEEEIFSMRMLLNHVRGPLSFEHLRTVDGITYQTFKDAATTLGLLENDGSLRQCLLEASTIRMPSALC